MEPRLGALSESRRRLVETMQEIEFGRIDGLSVRDGQPTWSPPPRLVRQFRLGKGDVQRSVRRPHDFVLRAEVVELLALFDAEPDLCVESVEIQNGLPVRVAVAAQGRP